MPMIAKTLSLAVLWLSFWATCVFAADAATVKKIAALSDFGAKLDALAHAVDDVTVSGALALLAHQYPNWAFETNSGFGSGHTGVSNDVSAVAAGHEYGMGKLRGALFRNKHVSDAQRDLAVQLLAQVKDLILVGYELEKLVDAGDTALAGQHYREQILTRSDVLNQDIDQLSKEIDQAIKFSAP